MSEGKKPIGTITVDHEMSDGAVFKIRNGKTLEGAGPEELFVDRDNPDSNYE